MAEKDADSADLQAEQKGIGTEGRDRIEDITMQDATTDESTNLASSVDNLTTTADPKSAQTLPLDTKTTLEKLSVESVPLRSEPVAEGPAEISAGANKQVDGTAGAIVLDTTDTKTELAHSKPESDVEPPSQDTRLINPTHSYEDIRYEQSFTDALMHPVLHPPGRQTKSNSGTRIIAPTSDERLKHGCVRYEDLDFDTLPSIQNEELPIPLDDPRRIYASGVPGIKLTHPGGWIEGGTGPYPALSASVNGGNVKLEDQPVFVREFLTKHGITNAEELLRAVKSEREVRIEELRRRMRDREEALEKNEKVRAKIQELVAEREMERRVHEKSRELRRRAREDG